MRKERNIDLFKAIRVLAAEAVKERDEDYLERYIMRWYSKTFFTPMAQVYEIPFEEILQAFFEEYYEKLDEEELDKEIQELVETDEERKTRLLELAAEELMAQQLIKASEIQNQSLAQTQLQDPKHKAPPKKPMKGTDKQGSMMPETATPLPPDIEMEFILEEDFNKLINGLSEFKDVLSKAKTDKAPKPPKKP